jgi:hypothetical protein
LEKMTNMFHDILWSLTLDFKTFIYIYAYIYIFICICVHCKWMSLDGKLSYYVQCWQ